VERSSIPMGKVRVFPFTNSRGTALRETVFANLDRVGRNRSNM